jgi:uncharacterized membrane protein YobD (UPF0266 family)
MSIKHNFNLQLKNIKDLKLLNWDSNLEDFNISIDFGDINQVRLLDDLVLFIQFNNGELRIDMNKIDLKNIKDVLTKNKN